MDNPPEQPSQPQGSQPPLPENAAQPAHHGCVVAWLAAILIMGLICLCDIPTVITRAGMDGWTMKNMGAVCLHLVAIINLCFAFGIYRWRGWGFYGIAYTSALVFVFMLVMGNLFAAVMFSVPCIATLYFALRAGGDRMDWHRVMHGAPAPGVSTTSRPTPAPPQPPPVPGVPANRREAPPHGCVTAWMVGIIAVSVVFLGEIPLVINDPIGPESKYEATDIVIVFLCAVANIIFAVAVFRLRKWGVYGIAVTSAAVFLIMLTGAQSLSFAVIMGLPGIVTLYFALKAGGGANTWARLK